MIPAITYTHRIKYYPQRNRTTIYGYKYNEFDNVIFSAKNLLSLSSNRISKIVTAAINEKNFIGKGKEGIVYKIPDTDYCIKLMNNQGQGKTNFINWTTKIDEADEINHIVAKADNGAVIMRFIDGINMYEYLKKADSLPELPDNEYRKLLKQISDAEKIGLEFDNVAANVIYNPKNKTLTAIDFYKSEIWTPSYPCIQVFSALENKQYGINSTTYNKKLAGKLMNIALEEYAKKGETEFKLKDYDILSFIRNIIGKNYKVSSQPQYKFLEQSFVDITKLKQAQRRGEDVDIELAGKIKYAKAIIKQLLTDI